MTEPQTALAEALAARLCHDLAGLAGTVSNLLDFAEADPEEALPLAQDAARRLVRRLRVLRAARGGVAQWPQDGLGALIGDLATDALPIALDAGTTRLARRPGVGRLLLNVALLGTDTLAGRGRIAFRAGPGRVITATLASSGAVPDWPALAASDVADPRHFQRGWTTLVAASCDTTLQPAGARLRLIPAA